MAFASVDDSLRDLHNSSHYVKAEFNNCLLFIQNISKLLTSLTLLRIFAEFFWSFAYAASFPINYSID